MDMALRRRDEAVARTAPRPIVVGRGFCIAVVAVLFIAHIAFGANGPALGLAFAMVQAALLASLICFEWGRREVSRPFGLLIPGLLFAGALGVCLLALTPVGGAPNAPLWRPLGVAATASINHETTVIEGIKLLGLACLLIVGAAIGRGRDRAWWTLQATVASGVAYAVFSLALHFYSPESLFGYPIWTGRDRLAATLGSANVAGTLFGLLLLCSAAVLLQHRRDVERRTSLGVRQFDLFVKRAPMALIGFGLFACCLLMTASRGAVAATVAMLMLLLIWEGVASGLKPQGWLTPLIIVCALIGSLAFAGDMVAERYQQSPQAAADRIALAGAHWRAFLQSPTLGSGLGAFADINRMLMTRSNYSGLASLGATHNVFVEWLEQAGWVGSALMWASLAWILVQILMSALRRLPLSVLPRLAVASSGLLIVHGLTDFALEVPSIAAFWTLLLGTALGRASY